MSSLGAPNQTSLWSWLEKDLKNKDLIQDFMLSSSKDNLNNNNQQIIKNEKKAISKKNRHRKMKRKKKQTNGSSKKVHFNQSRQRTRISDYMDLSTSNKIVSPEDNHEYYGDNYTSKADGTIRIWFTNPCGLGVRAYDQKSHASFSFLKNRSRCDIFGLAETNVNWHKLSGSATFYSRVKASWQEYRTISCHNTHQDLGIHQRGGNCMAVVGQVAHRLKKSGKDSRSLGRWVWMEFSGREEFSTKIGCGPP